MACKSGECFSEQENFLCVGKEKHQLKELETERRDKRPVCGKYVNGKGEETREDRWIKKRNKGRD